MRLFLAISAVMSVLLFSCDMLLQDCRSWVEATLEIPNSPWQVLRRTRGCSGLDSGMTYIIAKNRVSGKVIHVVDVERLDTAVELGIDDNGRLVVSLPVAPVEWTGKQDSFDGIEVVYQFRAREPGDADAYRLWLDHHDDPKAVAWCRSKGWGPFSCDPRKR